MDTYRLQQSQQKNLHSDPTQLHELSCLKKEVSFCTLTGHELEKVYNGKYVFPSTSKNTQFYKKSKQFSKIQANNKIQCLYYEIADFNKMVEAHANSFSLLHLNISSLPYYLEKFDVLFNSLQIKFIVIGITKSCLKLNVQPLVNINLKNCNNEKTQTESEKGGALLYISSDKNHRVNKYKSATV